MAWLLFFTRCDVFCDLLQYTYTEKCNLFVLYNKNTLTNSAQLSSWPIRIYFPTPGQNLLSKWRPPMRLSSDSKFKMKFDEAVWTLYNCSIGVASLTKIWKVNSDWPRRHHIGTQKVAPANRRYFFRRVGERERKCLHSRPLLTNFPLLTSHASCLVCWSTWKIGNDLLIL